MGRYFSPAQKREMYIRAGGRCERCRLVLVGEWNAHHVIYYSSGGGTEINNGEVLCESCHLDEHGRNVMRPRLWQENVLEKWKATRSSLLVEASVGAGKTRVAAMVARQSLDSGESSFVIAVVPKKPIVSSFKQTFAQLGIEAKSKLTPGSMPPENFGAAVITYQSLPGIMETIRIWVRNGRQVLVILDEIHHCALGTEESNVWGKCAGELGSLGARVLALTGTPFRPSGEPIAFLRYDGDGVAVPDVKHTYEEAVAAGHCRPVLFQLEDSDVEYSIDGQIRKVRMSTCPTSEASRVKSVAFSVEQDFMPAVIRRALERVNHYRASDPDAGCLIVCRAGTDPNFEETDLRHLESVARLVKKVTGEDPVVVSHKDQDEAAAKIDRFREGKQKFIVAIRMISEGVDIPRLRVCVLANAPDSELLFRQIVGRVVRQERRHKPQDSTVFLAKFPQLIKWAAEFRKQAEAGLRKREEPGEPKGEPGADRPVFVHHYATHEAGGGVIHGESLDADVLAFAEELIDDPAFIGMPPGGVALVARRWNERKPLVENEPVVPLEDRIKKKRDLLTGPKGLLRTYGALVSRRGGDYQKATLRLWGVLGVRGVDDLCDNYPESKVDEAMRIVSDWISDERN